MVKQIINKAKDKIQYKEDKEFVVMTKYDKQILTLLLKRYTLLIELKDKRLIEATYKDVKIIGRTPDDILLVYDNCTDKEIEINIDDIRIVRVCK